MPLFDISVPISPERTPVYRGDPTIHISSSSAIAMGDVANVTKLEFGAHTGTHLDAPAHFIEGGSKVIDLNLDDLIGEARVIEIPEDVREIAAEHVTEEKLQGAKRVLFRTKNSSFWRTYGNEFREDFVYVGAAAAESLVRQNVRVVGIDYLSVEKFGSNDFPAHRTLLARDVVIIEGLDLSGIKAGVYQLICLPIKIAAGTGDGAPARCVLRTMD